MCFIPIGYYEFLTLISNQKLKIHKVRITNYTDFMDF